MSSVPHKMRLVSNQITRLICQRHADTFRMYPVLEYPKCGGTWLCRMLADTLQLPFAQFASMPIAMPSVVHGHWNYHKGFQNTTFLVRDGRDVMVSFYFHFVRLHERAQSNKFKKGLRHLYGDNPDLTNIRANLPKFIEYINENPLGSPTDWATYNDRWWDQPGVVYTRYEALRNDCLVEMRRISKAHGIECDDWRLERAVEGHSMERAAGRKPGQEDRNSFIRKGVVGDWKNHFNQESLRVFSDICGPTLARLGYEQSPDWRTWDTAPTGTTPVPTAKSGERTPA